MKRRFTASIILTAFLLAFSACSSGQPEPDSLNSELNAITGGRPLPLIFKQVELMESGKSTPIAFISEEKEKIPAEAKGTRTTDQEMIRKELDPETISEVEQRFTDQKMHWTKLELEINFIEETFGKDFMFSINFGPYQGDLFKLQTIRSRTSSYDKNELYQSGPDQDGIITDRFYYCYTSEYTAPGEGEESVPYRLACYSYLPDQKDPLFWDETSPAIFCLDAAPHKRSYRKTEGSPLTYLNVSLGNISQSREDLFVWIIG